jgi:hypothetical protein
MNNNNKKMKALSIVKRQMENLRKRSKARWTAIKAIQKFKTPLATTRLIKRGINRGGSFKLGSATWFVIHPNYNQRYGPAHSKPIQIYKTPTGYNVHPTGEFRPVIHLKSATLNRILTRIGN